MPDYPIGVSLQDIIAQINQIKSIASTISRPYAAEAKPIISEFSALKREAEEIMRLTAELSKPIQIPTAPPLYHEISLPLRYFAPQEREYLRTIWKPLQEIAYKEPTAALSMIRRIGEMFPATTKIREVKLPLALLEELTLRRAGLPYEEFAEIVKRFPKITKGRSLVSPFGPALYESLMKSVKAVEPKGVSQWIAQLYEFEPKWAERRKEQLAKLNEDVWRASIARSADKIFEEEKKFQAAREEIIAAASYQHSEERLQRLKELGEREANLRAQIAEKSRALIEKIDAAKAKEELESIQKLRQKIITELKLSKAREIAEQQKADKEALTWAKKRALEELKVLEEKSRREYALYQQGYAARRQFLESIPLIGGLFRTSPYFGAGGLFEQMRAGGFPVTLLHKMIAGAMEVGGSVRSALSGLPHLGGLGRLFSFGGTIGGGIIGALSGAFSASGPIGAIASTFAKIATFGAQAALGIIGFAKSIISFPMHIITTIWFLFNRILFTIFLIANVFRSFFREPIEIIRHIQSGVMAASGSLEQFGESLRNVISLSLRYSVPIADIAKGFETISKSGFSAAEANQILASTVKYSTIFQNEFGNAIELVVGILKTFDIEARNVEKVVSMLYQTNAITVGSISDLATAMGYAGSAAASFGVSLEQTLPAITMLLNMGIRASRAGEFFRTALSNIERAAAASEGQLMDISEALSVLGLSAEDFYTEVTRKSPIGEYTDTVLDLQKVWTAFNRTLSDGISLQEKMAMRTIFGVRHAGIAAALFRKNVEEYEKARIVIQQHINLEEKAAVISDTLAGIFEKLHNAWVAFRIAIYEGMQGPLRSLSINFEKLFEPLQRVGNTLGRIFSTEVIEPIIKSFIDLTETIDLSQFIERLGRSIIGGIKQIVSSIVGMLSEITTSTYRVSLPGKSLMEKIIGLPSENLNFLDAVELSISVIAGIVSDAIQISGKTAVALISEFLENLGKITNIISSIKKFFEIFPSMLKTSIDLVTTGLDTFLPAFIQLVSILENIADLALQISKIIFVPFKPLSWLFGEIGPVSEIERMVEISEARRYARMEGYEEEEIEKLNEAFQKLRFNLDKVNQGLEKTSEMNIEGALAHQQFSY